jgi:hypothetical protein
MIEMTPDEYRALTKRPKAARYAPTEASEQIALFEWIDVCIPREPRLELAFHVPNGGLRNKGVAGELKAMGVRPGVPDVLLPIAARGYIGLAIELKAGTNTTSDLQDRWLGRLRDCGWYADYYHGWVKVAQVICWYLNRSLEEMGLGV